MILLSLNWMEIICIYIVMHDAQTCWIWLFWHILFLYQHRHKARLIIELRIVENRLDAICSFLSDVRTHKKMKIILTCRIAVKETCAHHADYSTCQPAHMDFWVQTSLFPWTMTIGSCYWIHESYTVLLDHALMQTDIVWPIGSLCDVYAGCSSVCFVKTW